MQTFPSGENLPQTKLTAADVLAIRGSSMRVTDLARQFNTSKSNISSIRSLRHRRNVGGDVAKAGGKP